MAVNQESTPKTNDDKTKASEEESKSRSLTSMLGGIAQISGVVTVVAGTIYVLGMLTLLLPIIRTYDITFSTAWYMVSVVPNTTVAGYGVRSLIWPSLVTVISLAFIVVMVWTLASLLWTGVRNAAQRAMASDGSLSRGVLRITAVYAGYSAVLGGALLIVHYLREYAIVEVLPYRFFGAAAALAYGIFALLCMVALSLLTLQAATYATRLVRIKTFSYGTFQGLGSLRASLYLALYVALASVVLSGLVLVRLFLYPSTQSSSNEPLVIVWNAVVITLIILLFTVLTLLFLDKALPLAAFEDLSLTFRVLGIALRMFIIVAVVGAALLVIVATFVTGTGLTTDGLWEPLIKDRVLQILDRAAPPAVGVILFLFLGMLLVLLLGTFLPSRVRRAPEAMLRVLLTMVVIGSIALCIAFFIRSEQTLQNRIFLMVLGVAVAVFLVLRGILYILRLRKDRTLALVRLKPLLSKRVQNLKDRWASQSIQVLGYPGVYLGVFYLILVITFLYGRDVTLRLNDDINSLSSEGSSLDELFIDLWIVGGFACGVLLYRKGLYYDAKENFFLAENWRSFIGNFRRAVLPSSVRRWFVWIMGGTYVLSVATALLVAYLEEPPLPRVELLVKGENGFRPQLEAPAGDAGFQSNTKWLLAHADGYWYLLDEDEGDVLVVPDQDDQIIHAPEYVEVVDETGALKIEVPNEWDEKWSDYPLAWPTVPAAVQTSRLTVSTNVDNWGEEYVEPGIFVEAYSQGEWKERWHNPVTESTLGEIKRDMGVVETHSPHCGRADEIFGNYDLKDEDNHYEARITRWRNCEEGGSYVAELWAVPEDLSFVLNAQVQFPRDNDPDADSNADYNKELSRLLRGIEVRDDLLS